MPSKMTKIDVTTEISQEEMQVVAQWLKKQAELKEVTIHKDKPYFIKGKEYQFSHDLILQPKYKTTDGTLVPPKYGVSLGALHEYHDAYNLYNISGLLELDYNDSFFYSEMPDSKVAHIWSVVNTGLSKKKTLAAFEKKSTQLKDYLKTRLENSRKSNENMHDIFEVPRLYPPTEEFMKRHRFSRKKTAPARLIFNQDGTTLKRYLETHQDQPLSFESKLALTKALCRAYRKQILRPKQWHGSISPASIVMKLGSNNRYKVDFDACELKDLNIESPDKTMFLPRGALAYMHPDCIAAIKLEKGLVYKEEYDHWSFGRTLACVWGLDNVFEEHLRRHLAYQNSENHNPQADASWVETNAVIIEDTVLELSHREAGQDNPFETALNPLNQLPPEAGIVRQIIANCYQGRIDDVSFGQMNGLDVKAQGHQQVECEALNDIRNQCDVWLSRAILLGEKDWHKFPPVWADLFRFSKQLEKGFDHRFILKSRYDYLEKKWKHIQNNLMAYQATVTNEINWKRLERYPDSHMARLVSKYFKQYFIHQPMIEKDDIFLTENGEAWRIPSHILMRKNDRGELRYDVAANDFTISEHDYSFKSTRAYVLKPDGESMLCYPDGRRFMKGPNNSLGSAAPCLPASAVSSLKRSIKDAASVSSNPLRQRDKAHLAVPAHASHPSRSDKVVHAVTSEFHRQKKGGFSPKAYEGMPGYSSIYVKPGECFSGFLSKKLPEMTPTQKLNLCFSVVRDLYLQMHVPTIMMTHGDLKNNNVNIESLKGDHYKFHILDLEEGARNTYGCSPEFYNRKDSAELKDDLFYFGSLFAHIWGGLNPSDICFKNDESVNQFLADMDKNETIPDEFRGLIRDLLLNQTQCEHAGDLLRAMVARELPSVVANETTSYDDIYLQGVHFRMDAWNMGTRDEVIAALTKQCHGYTNSELKSFVQGLGFKYLIDRVDQIHSLDGLIDLVGMGFDEPERIITSARKKLEYLMNMKKVSEQDNPLSLIASQKADLNNAIAALEDKIQRIEQLYGDANNIKLDDLVDRCALLDKTMDERFISRPNLHRIYEISQTYQPLIDAILLEKNQSAEAGQQPSHLAELKKQMATALCKYESKRFNTDLTKKRGAASLRRRTDFIKLKDMIEKGGNETDLKNQVKEYLKKEMRGHRLFGLFGKITGNHGALSKGLLSAIKTTEKLRGR